MKIRLLLSISCLILFQSQAQICGADILHRQKLNTDSVYVLQAEMNIKALKKAAQIQKTASVIASYFGMQSTIYTIPVVVHILHTGGTVGTAFNPTDAVIQGAIDYL
ncbi:MAG TPA: hypothetical protein VK616_06740, partial [Flavitalea sp.]|nr:hypothetical protein [Flavitalea sp.]